MMVALLLLLAVQEETPIPPTLYDRVIELEITAEDPSLIDGKGPCKAVEYEVQFEGTLHVWTRSDLDLSLRVEDTAEWRTLAEDEDSGGGHTPYARLEVRARDPLLVLVSGAAPETLGPLELHLVAAPESEATREAREAGRRGLVEAERLRSAGDPAGARRLLDTLFGELIGTEGANDSEEISETLVDVAIMARVLGDLPGARRAVLCAFRHRERTLPEDHPELLATRGNLALLSSATGDLPGALAQFERLVEILERTLPPDHGDLLQTRGNLAATLAKMGALGSARAVQEQVLAVLESSRSEDDPDLLRARGNLAVTMAELGDRAGARALLEQVLAARERVLPEDHPDLLWAQQSLAATMWEMGDTAGARALFEHVLDVRERRLPQSNPELLLARLNVAVSLRETGDLAEARGLTESVVADYERTLSEDHPDLLHAQQALVATLLMTGESASARALQERVLAVHERVLPDSHYDVVRARMFLANTMFFAPEPAAGDLAGAHALYASVVTTWNEVLPEDHPDLLGARHMFAATTWAMGERADARALASKLASGSMTRVLASLALAPRETRATVESEAQRLAGLLFLSRGGDPALVAEAFELIETMRAVAVQAARAVGRSADDSDIAPLLAEASTVRARLNDLVAGPADTRHDAEALAAELTRSGLERDRLEREISTRLAAKGVRVEAVELEALAASLTPDSVAVGFRRGLGWSIGEQSGRIELAEDQLLAHVLRADGSLTRVDLGPAQPSEVLAAAWRSALGAALVRGVAVDAGGEREAGEALRERILDPVLEAADDPVRRLYVCADDVVHLVPLDALPLGEGRVGDVLQVVNEVSFSRLAAPQDFTAGDPSLLVLGGVDYDAQGSAPKWLAAASAPVVASWANANERHGSRTLHYPSLLQSGFELEATAALFERAFGCRALRLSGQQATKQALFERAPGQRWLHLATHGWFAPDSIRSSADANRNEHGDFAYMGLEARVVGFAPMTLCGLALAGANQGRDSLGRVPGILTAEELCSLDLAQCELAVLSACETNVGIRRAGQGMQSLRAALHAAGVRTSITSLWRVDDASTRKLMEHFYTNLWVEKMGKADALWRAKVTMREAGHPARDWAGWVLTGDPD